jgi:hypothetical protein
MSTPAILAIFPSSIEFRASSFSLFRLKLETRNAYFLTLLLFMLWIFATDYHHYAFAPDNLAAIATRFD